MFAEIKCLVLWWRESGWTSTKNPSSPASFRVALKVFLICHFQMSVPTSKSEFHTEWRLRHRHNEKVVTPHRPPLLVVQIFKTICFGHSYLKWPQLSSISTSPLWIVIITNHFHPSFLMERTGNKLKPFPRHKFMDFTNPPRLFGAPSHHPTSTYCC